MKANFFLPTSRSLTEDQNYSLSHSKPQRSMDASSQY